MNKDIFKFEDIENFDEHISLSIQNYCGLSDIFTAIALECLTPCGTIIDVGCSTGRFLHEIPKIEANYFGCDVVDIREHDDFAFVKSKASSFLPEIKSADVIISMFSLQFMGKKERASVLSEMSRLVSSGAVLLISEKVYLESAKINHILQRELLTAKLSNFRADTILDKERDLIGSMFCQSSALMQSELEQIGRVEQVWQSFNFKGWCVSND